MLLAENRDKGLHVFFINQVDDPEAKRHRWRQYREVWGYVEGGRMPPRGDPAPLRRSLRRAGGGPLLRYLRRAPRGDRDGDGPPGARRPADGDVEAAILRVVREAAPSVGRTRAVEILRGGRSKVVLRNRYDELPGYGAFDDWRADDLLHEVDALIERGALRSTGGRFPKLVAAERAA